MKGNSSPSEYNLPPSIDDGDLKLYLNTDEDLAENQSTTPEERYKSPENLERWMRDQMERDKRSRFRCGVFSGLVAGLLAGVIIGIFI